ncbi:MAG: vWA domain-containing protein [Myxococcota bacterium]
MIRMLAIGAALTVFMAPGVARADLDVVFALDTTASMGHEINEAKTRIQQIAKALRAARPQEKLRFGLVAFRDKGDAYVTKRQALTTDIARVEAFIVQLSPGGGGDGPEHVLAALEVAIDQTAWGAGERQVFVIGDAPPHFDYAGSTLEDLLERARANKIVINAIGCRSLPSDGVRAFRTMAYETEGAYQHIGRVTVGASDEGLAGAVLRSLGGERENEAQTSLVKARQQKQTVSNSEHLEVTPVLKAGEICALDVEVPGFFKLVGALQVRRGHKLYVKLGRPVAFQGKARRVRYALEPCSPATLPLSIRIGG